MQDDMEMTIDERRKYLRLMRARYLQADGAGRSHLLDEMQTLSGMHRKSLIRLLHTRDLARRPRTKHTEFA